MTYANSPELFIRNIAESMENQHYMQTPGQYITEAFVNEALKGYDRIDEGFMDVMKTLLKPITWPVAKIADFWKKDREFVNEVSKAEKAIPKHVVAALYSEEFANTNIVQDLWDMLCMLKDVVLFSVILAAEPHTPCGRERSRESPFGGNYSKSRKSLQPEPEV